ncbi:hypothetical protein FXB40_36865 [Bradyrhizobium rifense]|uniref:Aminotransferase class I/II-fold pyridoxal phosphate-dependent enzyme n=1 Tax=Bradyrhizobium rifense TaxID=515499 RepID=A0A5D3KEJ1_9BRAD|nr:hypothetical protein [Bradyrhizobium rifense]TYL89162.1 hypothetical protein FXB40_36865 [Bradyrhizobium rifense]
METLETYLDRKYEELELLNGSLRKPLTVRRPESVVEVIERKFHLAAALKAEHALHEWASTETAWAQPDQRRSGPFEFSYDYQRADLDVIGPSFYQIGDTDVDVCIYTSSGMAAISALLLASARVVGEAELLLLPGSYSETVELIELHARHLSPLVLEKPLGETVLPPRRPRMLLLDSCAAAEDFAATLRCAKPELDLVIFDTTCFSSGSGRIRRVIDWTRRHQVPVVLVRSHTKLDSLGLEYGRLGSAAFLRGPAEAAGRVSLRSLIEETRIAVRLFGGAALPAHFPPYAGSRAYRHLTNRRIAAMLHNSRRTVRCFASELACASAELHFAHGLYVTLAPSRALDERQAKQVAAELSHDLSKAGLPLRHAGSFGFDFGAAEWSYDGRRERHVVRIAVPDLPTALWDEVALAAANWWSAWQAPKRGVR